LLRNVVTPDDLKEDMLSTIADRAFIGDDELPRSSEEFMTMKQRARTRLPAVKDALCRIVNIVATEYNLLATKQEQMPVKANRITHDVGNQIKWLVYKGCFSQTPWEKITHLPRYLKALRLRIEKQASNPERDGKHAGSIGALWQKWESEIERQRKLDNISSSLQDFRWLIEELRVSLFAQELKTPFPVSIKRLEKAWAALR
jgi:ATP-dependent helicase HrpA